MKLTSRGFTLVELMIVIAIIGILAAALFPGLTSYLANARDTERVANIRNIKLAAMSYFITANEYSSIVNPNNCINPTVLLKYMSNKVPQEGVAGYTHANCPTGDYATATGKLNLTPAILFYATLESEGKGNTIMYDTMAGLAGTNLSFINGLKTGGTNTGYLDVQ